MHRAQALFGRKINDVGALLIREWAGLNNDGQCTALLDGNDGIIQVSDIANGYRAIRASRLSEIAFTEEQFHNPELLLGAARAGLHVIDVPVTIRRRPFRGTRVIAAWSRPG